MSQSGALVLRILLGDSVGKLLDRSVVWAVMNLLFFGGILSSGFLTRFPLMESSGGLEEFPAIFPLDLEWPLLVGYIFVLNLFASAFLMVTLSGLVFFVLSSSFLVLRACIWGVSLSRLSTPMFLMVLPTIVIEGEAYVIAAVAGTVLGLSWLKPSWAYGGKAVSRGQALRLAVKECASLYVLVAMMLIVAAVIEALTIQQVYSI